MSYSGIAMMVTGTILIAVGVVSRKKASRSIGESASEVALRRSSWPGLRFAAASVVLGALIFLLGLVAVLAKAMPSALVVLAGIYVLMLTIGLTAIARRYRESDHWWQRLISACVGLARGSP